MTGALTRSRRRVGHIVIKFNIRIFEGLVQAADNRLDIEGRIMSQCVRKDVASGDFDRLLEKIVLENNKTAITSSGVADDVFPVLQNLLDARESAMDIEI